MLLLLLVAAPCLPACLGHPRPLHMLCPPRACREFEIWRYTPPAGSREALPPPAGPLLMLVQQGAMHVRSGEQSRLLKRGDVYFVAAGAELQLEASADVSAWVTACNGMAF